MKYFKLLNIYRARLKAIGVRGQGCFSAYNVEYMEYVEYGIYGICGIYGIYGICGIWNIAV